MFGVKEKERCPSLKKLNIPAWITKKLFGCSFTNGIYTVAERVQTVYVSSVSPGVALPQATITKAAEICIRVSSVTDTVLFICSLLLAIT